MAAANVWFFTVYAPTINLVLIRTLFAFHRSLPESRSHCVARPRFLWARSFEAQTCRLDREFAIHHRARRSWLLFLAAVCAGVSGCTMASNSASRTIVRDPTFTRVSLPLVIHRRIVQGLTPPRNAPALSTECSFPISTSRILCLELVLHTKC